MKNKFFITVAVVSAACILGACSRTESDEPLSQVEAVGVALDYEIHSYEELQQFSYDLFNKVIDENKGKNPVISPVSAYLALSMAGFGADGDTKKEFYDVLGESMMVFSDDLMNNYQANSDVLTLSLANSAWIDDQFHVNENWLGTIQSISDAEAFQAHLSDAGTMNSMNRWIEDKTNGLIEKMIEEPLDTDSRLVLFNTLYFKGKWSSPFEQYMTITDIFNLADGNTVEVDMMRKFSEQLNYLSNDFAEGVILPYQNVSDDDGGEGVHLAFVVLKPKETGGMDMADQVNFGSNGYIWELTDEVIKDLLDSAQTRTVNLKLPKFAITFDKVLNESLQNMGLTDCFDHEKANFSQMGKTESGENMYISLVRQKAKIIVDEEGTEAAAATEVLAKDNAALMTEEPIELFFDKPFLYMIMDMDKEIPLFIGVMDNPVED